MIDCLHHPNGFITSKAARPKDTQESTVESPRCRELEHCNRCYTWKPSNSLRYLSTHTHISRDFSGTDSMSRRFGSRELLHPSFANAPKPNKSSPPEVNHIKPEPDTRYPENDTVPRELLALPARYQPHEHTGCGVYVWQTYECSGRPVFGARAMGRGYCCYISASSPKYLVDVLFGFGGSGGGVWVHRIQDGGWKKEESTSEWTLRGYDGDQLTVNSQEDPIWAWRSRSHIVTSQIGLDEANSRMVVGESLLRLAVRLCLQDAQSEPNHRALDLFISLLTRPGTRLSAVCHSPPNQTWRRHGAPSDHIQQRKCQAAKQPVTVFQPRSTLNFVAPWMIAMRLAETSGRVSGLDTRVTLVRSITPEGGLPPKSRKSNRISPNGPFNSPTAAQRSNAMFGTSYTFSVSPGQSCHSERLDIGKASNSNVSRVVAQRG
ncbi:hypothetical protein AB1N83_004366 [Pleurotus pulmonarius]